MSSADSSPLSVAIAGSLRRIDRDAWDACAGRENPFVGYDFLSALEDSGSVTAKTGWAPQHLVLSDAEGAIRGCVPMYLKNHSYGEYVFDHGWAAAYERAGGRYYPKLQVCVPFTPVPGPRLLVHPTAERERIVDALIRGLEAAAAQLGVASLHVTFPWSEEWEAFGERGWLQRTGQQFHWENAGYRDFDGFLDQLSSRKRKAIRKERREVETAGVRLCVLTGDDLTSDAWDDFYRFYTGTSDRKWGYPYLNREFFRLLGERMADRVALVMADADGRRVAGALNLIGSDTLYGRNWGCDAHVPFLHFEACYYQAIEFAISRGLKRVEAGAQGEHKIQRGYLPRRTYSAHLIRDRGLKDAIADFLAREREMVDWEIAALGTASPFRQADQ